MSKNNPDHVCENCESFERSENRPTEGVCRRYPPHSIVVRDNPSGRFPEVWEKDYCREFKQSEEATP